MKKLLCLAFSLLALNLTPVFGQPALVPGPKAIVNAVDPYAEMSANKPVLTKFNLDFPGGTPKELVAAIEKATGKPLNAIIPDEAADTKLPPLKMDDVDVARLFKALEYASSKQVAVVTSTYNGGNSSYSTYNLSYGFKTDGQPSDSSVWYFHADKPVLPPMNSSQKVCQYYSLSPYLDRGFTVDDITTAIQTGWKMSGETSPPELNYHKETGLLIAFGEPSQLKTINDVLGTLPQLKYAYWQEMNKNIFQLSQQVKELQQKISAAATNAAPAEKSGK